MNTPISNNEILNAFETLVPVLKIIFDDEISFAIANRDVFLKIYNCPSLVFKHDAGSPISEGGAAREAINTGKVIIKIVPKEVYGVPFKSCAIPVKGKDGNVEGVILAGKSLAKKNEVLGLSQQLSTSLQQISDTISSLSASVNDLVSMNINIENKMKEVSEITKNTDAIIEFVQTVASQTNLLGLNAAIEAVRAGEEGKGFRVVVQEIRKLSQSTAESIKKVDQVLKDIKSSIENVSDNITNSNGIFQEQAAAFEEIASSIEELNSTSQILEQLSEKI